MNFGGAPGPWDHSRRLEKIGRVKASGLSASVYSVGLKDTICGYVAVLNT